MSDNDFREFERYAQDNYFRAIKDGVNLSGWGIVHLMDGDGKTKSLGTFGNIVTTVGDQYYATMGIALVSPSATAQPTKMTGMKLGTSTTATAKSSTGASLVTYLTGSNVVFDATYPNVVAVGGDLGYYAVYKTTWGAGVATSATINEVVIVNDAATNATSTAANTISRALMSTQNKGASDILAITWNHKFLGA